MAVVGAEGDGDRSEAIYCVSMLLFALVFVLGVFGRTHDLPLCGRAKTSLDEQTTHNLQVGQGKEVPTDHDTTKLTGRLGAPR